MAVRCAATAVAAPRLSEPLDESEREPLADGFIKRRRSESANAVCAEDVRHLRRVQCGHAASHWVRSHCAASAAWRPEAFHGDGTDGGNAGSLGASTGLLRGVQELTCDIA